MNRMKKGLASLALAGSIIGTTVVGAGAAPVTQVQVTQNGAGGLIDAVVVALNNVNVNVENVDVAVVELNNSLNNLQALNNVLNNNDIDIVVQDVNVLTDFQIEILENADIDIDDVVAVAILDNGDIIVFR